MMQALVSSRAHRGCLSQKVITYLSVYPGNSKMRNSHRMVPLFSVQGHCLRHITIREAERMVEMKQAHRVSARNKPLKIQLKMLERGDCATPATITVGELMANAFAHTSLKGAQSHTALLYEDQR